MSLDARWRRLAEEMGNEGCWPTDSPWVRAAMDTAPRHRFAPERVWEWEATQWVPVDRSLSPERWAAAVYGGPYDSTVTQVEDGLPSSSLSCPSVVADMLDSLVVEPGHLVLELGTGSGWNAALLALRAGSDRVTSVEVDPRLAAEAAKRLTDAGLGVTVQAGDGALGWPDGAPYDRLIATYAVDRVPWAWVRQTRPGGRIVTPWGRLGHVALTVAEDGGSASGWVQGLATFMPSRGVDQGRAFHEVRRRAEEAGTEEPFARSAAPLSDPSLQFALRVQLPDVRVATRSAGKLGTAWLHDGHTSWALLTDHPDGRTTVAHGGPRRLDTEVTLGWDRWEREGSPSLYDFGMTRTEHDQWIWSDHNGIRRRWDPHPAESR
ncbi:methyltransferase domain-containing protein [Streptomyces sp. JJ38]|uniref:methyltransferase domain-containing protein n=1 Tax=Streptomyces sp. JJ38 TaxID=2738128 RepID=UPI001C57A679|nr:methyltransferase domain-containing protein [Streptomyces sp. JJ38]MBW1596490.1 methyltransferase domain-containing protein [Streptomyces sp. JJ38]